MPNHPAVGVSWYEALAYTRWLTDRWWERGWLLEGWVVRLPSEAEWEKAAQGGVQIPPQPIIASASELWGQASSTNMQDNPQPKTAYIWGNNPDPNKANYKESGIGTTSAVGCFPNGVSPYGCMEMTGNLFEWMQTKWGYTYPYKADERERIDASNDNRVRHGGYYGASSQWMRCAFRSWNHPRNDSDSRGFRVCVSAEMP